jgi:hypothetical protein
MARSILIPELPWFVPPMLANRKGLEGVVAKRLDGRYRPGRRAWIKIKPR